MYCLTPSLVEVPEGNWFCPECIDDSIVYDILLQYLHNIAAQRMEYCTVNNSLFSGWLTYHITSLQTLNDWKINITTVNEFDFYINTDQSIGNLIRIYIQNIEYCGRILNIRLDNTIDMVEHLIQFKSLNSDLNIPLILWINLSELICIVGYEIVCIRTSNSRWKPCQKHYKSAKYLLLYPNNNININNNNTNSNINNTVHLFDEDVYMYNVSETLLCPFSGKNGLMKEFRSSKRTNLAYALAYAEQVWYIYIYMLYFIKYINFISYKYVLYISISNIYIYTEL